MESAHKKILKALVLDIRHTLEGWRAPDTGHRFAGDLEKRLASLGIRRDREPVAFEELHLSPPDQAARLVVDAFLKLRAEAGVAREEGVGEFIRETAATWANRLLALRCMEARGLLFDEIVRTNPAYADRSLVHNRLVKRNPALQQEEDEGLFLAFEQVFAERAEYLPGAFDPKAPGIALRPSVSSMKDCIALLSGTKKPNGQEPATDAVFKAPDALGWAYQYWNTEEKGRVFDAAAGKGPDRKRHKIEGADIVPATQLYTEPYMVKFLVQNSLGATWAAMHTDTRLVEGWEYFVRDADRPRMDLKPAREITFLDPACGSGHFLIEAFDLFFEMYREEEPARDTVSIVVDILTRNLHGIDIDARAVGIAEIALWMKAAEKTAEEERDPPQIAGFNLVATNIRLPRGREHLESFLKKYPEDLPLKPALEVVFDGLAHADELGSLLIVEAPVEEKLRQIKQQEDLNQATRHRERQVKLFSVRGEQTALPLSALDWDHWRIDVLSRLRQHFSEEAQAADLVEAFFGRSVEQALDLFDLLSMRYDVVAANPPYMGSKNMGEVLKRCVQGQYKAAKRDLYAAFILRSKDMLNAKGRLAVVTQHSWMFLSSFADMRYQRATGTMPARGLLAETAIEALVHLGAGAFHEIGGQVVNTAMFTARKDSPDETHRITAVRLLGTTDPLEKTEWLIRSVQSRLPGLTYSPTQSGLARIVGSPLCYMLSEGVLALFTGATVGEGGEVRQGMATADDGRFLRFCWEVDANSRWSPFYKGGGYRKWDGLGYYLVDWEENGARIRETPGPRVQGDQWFFKPGWTYSRIAMARMGCRVQDPPGVIADKGPGIYLPDCRQFACLNSRVFTYLMRAVSPNLAFEVDAVYKGPLPSEPPDVDVNAIVTAKRILTATDPTERAFTGVIDLADRLAASSHLHTLEGEAERAVCTAYDLPEADITAIINDTGTPVGWLPEELPPPAGIARLKSLFESGFGVASTEEEPETDEEDDDEAPPTGGTPIHPETFLEELCQKVQLHPRAVLALLQEGMNEKGWRCPPEEMRIAADRMTVLVLHLLGHRWPRQIVANEPVPDWADADGIIPLTSIPNERPLLERVRDRLAAVGDARSSESDLSDALGQPLTTWLPTRFFDHHVRQFKKRPVAWQVQTGPYSARIEPAFACLIYGPGIRGDTLTRIRTVYTGPLLDRLKSEQRSTEALSERSDAQSDRLRALSGHTLSLESFNKTLRQIEETGFSTPALPDYALQDALQSLTQPLLVKARDQVIAGPLGEWLTDVKTIDTSLVEQLRAAVAAMPCSCARAVTAAWKDTPVKDRPTPKAESTIRPWLRANARFFVDFALLEVVEAWSDAFRAWMKAKREEAEQAGEKPPKFKYEKKVDSSLTTRIISWHPHLPDLEAFLAGLPLLDRWCAEPGRAPPPTIDEFVRQESRYKPDVNDGVRVNIAPIQAAGLLASEVLAAKDLPAAVADRASWRADERRWVREGRLPQPGWWPRGDAQ